MMMDTDHNEGGPLHEYLRDEMQENPADVVEQGSLIEELSSAIHGLSEREQLVLSLYYNDELTFKEVGRVLNITESRVCQLHARAILNLKAMMRDEQ
jgi:RNA polymerase sigma factor for flagellar operon FliA